ncbi:MAG: hypothetical protein Q9218_008143 [Villophora microphyllina]
MGISEDEIANAVLDAYDSLPARYKPVMPTEDFFQWVPLSGIVAVRKGKDEKPECLSLGTGMKCLPIDQVAQAQGSILHDWHAEIVALRAFNHFLLHECLQLATSPTRVSPIIQRRDPNEIRESHGLQPFAIHNDVQLHMYSSEAPCGDASMELLMELQTDPTPWPVEVTENTPVQLLGRGSFSELGTVRRKPGSNLNGRMLEKDEANASIARADSPRTLSKSCSDKITLKQCTSLLSSHTSLLVNPANAYLEALILPKTQCIAKSCDRSFGSSGRMKPVAGRQWSGGYACRPFNVGTTDLEFRYSRRSKPAISKQLRTSNISAVFHPHLQEALILGRLQGRQKFDPKGASAICSKRMWKLTLQILSAMGMPRLLQSVSESMDVRSLKESALFMDRQRVKDDVRAEALKGWMRNDSDDFEIEPD